MYKSVQSSRIKILFEEITSLNEKLINNVESCSRLVKGQYIVLINVKQ